MQPIEAALAGRSNWIVAVDGSRESFPGDPASVRWPPEVVADGPDRPGPTDPPPGGRRGNPTRARMLFRKPIGGGRWISIDLVAICFTGEILVAFGGPFLIRPSVLTDDGYRED